MPRAASDWEDARNELLTRITVQRAAQQGNDMSQHDDDRALDHALEEGLKAGAFFTAGEYNTLCSYAVTANAADRGEVSLVLPVVDSENLLTPISDSSSGGDEDEFVTLACVDISAHTAFLLASNLPLNKSPRDALSDNGLTIQGLSLREIRSAMRTTSNQITPKDF